MLLLKTKRPSTLTGRNVPLSNLLISSCLIFRQTRRQIPHNEERDASSQQSTKHDGCNYYTYFYNKYTVHNVDMNTVSQMK